MLASAGIDEQVYLINLKNRREYGALFGHSGSVNQVKFAANGSLYSASDDGLMIHWKNVKVPGSKKKSWEKMGQVSGKVKAVNSKAKIEESKFVSIGIHPSSNLAILGNAGAKGLDIVDLNNDKVVASKRLRGKGKKQQLDVPNFVEFTPDGQKMVIFSEPGTLRCKGIDGNDVWKVSSELTKVYDMKVTATHILLAGETMTAQDGKRVRVASLQVCVLESGVIGDVVSLYDNCRVKACEIFEDKLITGDSDGKIVVWQTDKDFKAFEKVNEVECQARITCMKMYRPSAVKRSAEDASKEEVVENGDTEEAEPTKKSSKISKKSV